MKNACTPRRHPAVIVEHLRFEVVEGPDTVDPMALHDALRLLARWAVQATFDPDRTATTSKPDHGEQA